MALLSPQPTGHWRSAGWPWRCRCRWGHPTHWRKEPPIRPGRKFVWTVNCAQLILFFPNVVSFLQFFPRARDFADTRTMRSSYFKNFVGQFSGLVGDVLFLVRVNPTVEVHVSAKPRASRGPRGRNVLRNGVARRQKRATTVTCWRLWRRRWTW